MEEAGKKEQGNKKVFEVTTFPVPLPLEEIKENIAIPTNTPTRLSKEEIINQAFKFHSQGNISEAAKYYQYFINQGFNDPRMFSNYGTILKDLGKLQEAEISTRKAIKLNPHYENAHVNLGNILKNLGKLKEAEISTRKAIELKPNYAEAHSNLGNILRDLDKLKEAELSLRKAIELNPDFASAHLNLGNILKNLGKLKEAELSTRKAIELNPDFSMAHLNLGCILRDLGQLEEAGISTSKAIELNPNFANAHYNLGSILRDLGKIDKAEISTRKAIELYPDFAMAHFNLGGILKDLGNLEEAEVSFSKAIALKPQNTSILMNRWQLFFDKKEFNNALKDADACNTKVSRVNALETLYALGRIDEIYERIEQTAELDDENIGLAAFSAFITEQEKKDTAHNFCQRPLEFLHFANLKFHVNDYVKFINEIINELREVKTVWEPRNHSTRNGFHTPTKINLFSNSSKNISQLKTIILNELDQYYLEYKQESCSYVQKWPSNKNLVAWHVILKKQGYQTAHIHPTGWLSGVIYLKVVPPLDSDEGAIEFSLNGQHYSNDNSPKLTFQPKLGDIILFPSSLYHRTIPFTTDTERIVISFDLMPH